MNIKKKKGIALAMVLIIFGALSVLGTTMLSLSVSETKQVMSQERNMQAYYAARSGADAMASYLIENPLKLQDMVTKTSFERGKGEINGGKFEVQVIDGGLSGDVTIKSRGIVQGASPVEVTLTLSRTSSMKIKQAVFTDGPLNLRNNTEVYGDIGSNSGDDVYFGNSKTKLHGNLVLGPEAVTGADGKYVGIDYSYVDGQVLKNEDEILFPDINESRFVESRTGMTSSETFAVEGLKRYIKVGKIDLSGNTNVVVSGKGELHLLVTGLMDMGGRSGITTTGGAKLFIYYTGTQGITIRGGSHFQGLIYAPNAEVEWKGGGNEVIKGSIIAKAFTAASSNTKIYFDDSLKFEELPITTTTGFERNQWSK